MHSLHGYSPVTMVKCVGVVIVMANKKYTSDSEHVDRATDYSEMKVWKATLRVTVQGKIRHWPSK